MSSPARVVLEVAAVGTKDELVDVIDQGLALRRFTAGELKVVLERHRGRRGAGRLAEVMADDTSMAISRSRAEKALLRLIRDARLPASSYYSLKRCRGSGPAPTGARRRRWRHG